LWISAAPAAGSTGAVPVELRVFGNFVDKQQEDELWIGIHG